MKSWLYECFAETCKDSFLPTMLQLCRIGILTSAQIGPPSTWPASPPTAPPLLSLPPPQHTHPKPQISLRSADLHTCPFPFLFRRLFCSEKQKSYPFFFSHSTQMAPFSWSHLSSHSTIFCLKSLFLIRQEVPTGRGCVFVIYVSQCLARV